MRQLHNGSTDQAQTSPVGGQDHFAVLVAEFRDSYAGRTKLCELAWWTPRCDLDDEKVFKDEVYNKVNSIYREINGGTEPAVSVLVKLHFLFRQS